MSNHQKQQNVLSVSFSLDGTPETDPKCIAILDAAALVFSAYGYRRTALEDVANEANISRSAIYLHYRNKKDLFRSLSAHQHALAIQSFAASLDVEGATDNVLLNALIARDEKMFALVHTSPHGAEIVDINFNIGADIAANYASALRKLLADWIKRKQGKNGALSEQQVQASEQLATVILLAANGQKMEATTLETYHQRLTLLSRIFSQAITGEV